MARRSSSAAECHLNGKLAFMVITSTNVGKPTRAATYLRISQDCEADRRVLSCQRKDSENLAKFRRWKVVKTYTNQSKSTTNKTAVRPTCSRMRIWKSATESSTSSLPLRCFRLLRVAVVPTWPVRKSPGNNPVTHKACQSI